MKVFISWSGERSEALAWALRDWLPLVLHYGEPWLSQADISAGERWGLEVAKELDDSTFGVTCITSENLIAPWLLFEAGALAKSMQEGRVVPLLLDIDFREISGPLAQFQAKKVERGGIWDTVCAINKISSAPVAEGRLNSLFEALWPDFEKQVLEIPKKENASKPTRPQGEVLEELVSGVRNLDVRFRDMMDEEPSVRRYPRSKIRSVMIDEIIHKFMSDKTDPVAILIATSVFKDEFPWIYELGSELYRSMSSQRGSRVRLAQENLIKGIEVVRRGPFMEGPGVDRRAMHFLLTELERLPDVNPQHGFGHADTEMMRVRSRSTKPSGGSEAA